MDASAFIALALACAPQVHTDTARALVGVESAFNPWAIGVVGGTLARQPRRRAEAIATARALRADGWNFSVGLGQINLGNFARLGLTIESAFEPCTNLAALQTVLAECFERAGPARATSASIARGTASPKTSLPGPPARQAALRRALSCYYSGNFATGFQHGYVQKVIAAALAVDRSISPRQPKEKT